MATFGSTELPSELPLASPKRHRGDRPSLGLARRQSPRLSPRQPQPVGPAALEEEGLDALEPLPAAATAPAQQRLMAPPQRRTSQARASRLNVRELNKASSGKQSMDDAAAITEEGTYLSLSQVEAGDLVAALVPRKRPMPEAPDDEADHLPSPARTATVRRSCSLRSVAHTNTPLHRASNRAGGLPFTSTHPHTFRMSQPTTTTTTPPLPAGAPPRPLRPPPHQL